MATQESPLHKADRMRHHRFRRDPTQRTNLHAPHALVVDDDIESIQPLQIVLHNFGFETTLAFDGGEALEEMTKKPFDIVFLDISMPQKTGLEVLQEIENAQSHGHKIPVVTYSSYDIAKYGIPDGHSFFFAGHWQKPLSLADLATLINYTGNDLGLLKKGGL